MAVDRPSLAPALDRMLVGYRLGDEAARRGATGGRVLQLGAGDGSGLVALASVGFDVEGVEADSAAVEVARARGLRMHPTVPDERFDVVIARTALNHGPDLDAALAGVRAALVDGGWLQVDLRDPTAPGARLARQRAGATGPRPAAPPVRAGQLLRALRRAGFDLPVSGRERRRLRWSGELWLWAQARAR